MPGNDGDEGNEDDDDAWVIIDKISGAWWVFWEGQKRSFAANENADANSALLLMHVLIVIGAVWQHF